MNQRDPANHEKFQKILIASEPARWLVAQWLSFEKKLTLHMEPLYVAPTRDEAYKYADNGDIMVVEKTGHKRRVEVKKLSAAFTSVEDWPFRDFIVCSKSSFDKAVPKPHSYIIVNASQTHAAIVLGANCAKWTTGARIDRRIAEEQLFYFSPLDDVEFIKIAEPKIEDKPQEPTTPQWQPPSTEGKLF